MWASWKAIAQIRHTREKTCEARFFIASELSGFVRLASLRNLIAPTLAVLHMLCVSVPSAYSGERLRSRISLASELRDGTRPCVLALKIHAVLLTCSPARSALFEYFEYFPARCARAHIHFSSGYAFVELISARWRNTEMCPCDAACKTVRLVEIFIDLSQEQIRHTREKTCEARFFIASELSGFVRLAFLR